MFNSVYLKDLNTAVFDIETTGLFSSRDCIINTGFCSPSGEVWQAFTEDPRDEKRVVEETVERLAALDAVITYNGDSFDLPFLQKRAAKYGICEKLPTVWSIDLYRWLKKYWPQAGSMKSLSQKAVEEALGLSARRTDEIGGGECIPLYNFYLQTGSEDAKDKILLHNADDVRQLARIAWKCVFLPYHEIAFREGFLMKAGSRKILLKGISQKTGAFHLEARADKGLLPISAYEDTFHLEYDALTGAVRLDLFTRQAENYLFTDLEKLGLPELALAALKELPGSHSGFLILAENGEPDFRAVNRLAQTLLAAWFCE